MTHTERCIKVILTARHGSGLLQAIRNSRRTLSSCFIDTDYTSLNKIRGSTVVLLLLQRFSVGLAFEYSLCIITVLNLDLSACCLDASMSYKPSRGPNNILYVNEPQQNLGRGVWPCKSGLSPGNSFLFYVVFMRSFPLLVSGRGCGLGLYRFLIIMPPPPPTEGAGDILFLLRILLASALASASAWHFLVWTIFHEPVGGF